MVVDGGAPAPFAAKGAGIGSLPMGSQRDGGRCRRGEYTVGCGARQPGVARVILPESGGSAICSAMEFLNFVLILVTGWLVWRRPEREGLAFGLLVVSCVLMALLFLIGTHGSLVPGVNL